jgi:uncharacterized membrane protein YcaP (DUF421 family)
MLFGILELAIYMWPISLPLALHVIVAIGLSWSKIRGPHLLSVLVTFIFPPLIVILGSVFAHSGARADAPMGPIVVVALVYFLQVAACGYLIYKNKGLRWFTISVCLVALWLGLIGWSIAGMALTNVWL